jgi:hypothetical protein
MTRFKEEPIPASRQTSQTERGDAKRATTFAQCVKSQSRNASGLAAGTTSLEA